MSNPYKLTSQVSLAPDPQLSSMMEKFKQVGDAISFSVVFNEVQRRKEVRDAAQSKMMGGPKPQVADQLIQESKMAQMPALPQGMGGPQGMPPQGMPPQGMGGPQGMPPQGMPPQGMPPQMAMGPQGGPPQGLPEGSGIGQLPAPNMQNMAGGGIVSFAGDEDSYLGVQPYGAGDELDSRPYPLRTYNLSDEPPATDETETETGLGGLGDLSAFPRLDLGDSAGDYRARMDKLMADQEAQNKEYETKRSALGKAYANAEERDKEFSQRYADEERVQSGLPWIAAGAALMQSSGKGISGLADAINAGLPQYVSGREKLTTLKDKQRDYMQTVAEARRAEELGQLDKFRELQASLATKRMDIEGNAANLAQSDKKLRADYDMTLAAATAKGAGGVKTLAGVYAPRLDKAFEDVLSATTPEEKAKATATYQAILEAYGKAKGMEVQLDPKMFQQKLLAAQKDISDQKNTNNTPLGRANAQVQVIRNRINKKRENGEQVTAEDYSELQTQTNEMQRATNEILAGYGVITPASVINQGGGAGAGGGGGSGPDLYNPPWMNQ
jgi:hypothetical protein